MNKLLLTGLCVIALGSNAFTQMSPDGTVMPNNVVFTDINGTTHDLFDYTSQGKHVVLDLFMTTCGFCWAHHNAGYFEDYNTAHAVAGSTEDAVVLAFEVNGATTQADLEGTGGSTLGDWLTGTNIPVTNTDDNGVLNTTIRAFIPTGGFGTPQLVLICSDRSFYKLSTTQTAASIRTMAETSCGVTASLDKIDEPGTVSRLFPNPVRSIFSYTVALAPNELMELTVTNSVGQKVEANALSVYSEKGKTFQVNTSSWTDGVYVVQIKTDLGVSTRRLVVQH